MNLRKAFFLLSFILPLACLSWDKDRKVLIAEGISRLKELQTINSLNNKNHLSEKNEYLVVLDDRDESYLKVRNNSNPSNSITEEAAKQLNKELTKISEKGIETYLVVVNFLPIIVTREVEPGATVTDLLSSSYSNSSKLEAEKAREEFASICNSIFDGLKSENKVFYCGYGNYYAIYKKDVIAKRISVFQSRPNPNLTIDIKDILNKNILSTGLNWGGTDTDRARTMVRAIGSTIDQYLGNDQLTDDYSQKFIDYLKANYGNTYQSKKAQIERIAGFIKSMGPVYKDYVEWSKTQILYRGIDASVYSNNIWAVKPDVLDDFEKAISKYNSDVTKARTFLAAVNGDPKKVNALIGTLSSMKGLGSLTAQERLHLLKELTKTEGGMRDDFLFGNKAEKYAIEIMSTAPESQANALIAGLKADKLLVSLTAKIDGDNFATFIEIITSWIATTHPPSGIAIPDLMASRNYIEFDGDFFGPANSKDYDSDGQVKLTVRKNFQFSYSSDLKVDPYQYVAVKFQKDYNLSAGGKFSAGEIIKIPAIYSFYLFNDANNQKLITASKTTLNVGLFALGIGEIMAAKNGIQLTLALIDMNILVADLAISGPLAEKLSTKYPGFLDAWNKLNIIYGVGRLSLELPNLGKHVSKSGKEILVDASARLTVAERTMLEKLILKTDEIAGAAREVSILARFPSIRKYLSGFELRKYLNDNEFYNFDLTLRTAHAEVLKQMDEMKELEFVEMVRGYKDLIKKGNLVAFEKAIASKDNFNQWIKFWSLTPKMEAALTTIGNLKRDGKVDDVGNATDVQLASIYSYTANGDFINVPYRYRPEWFGEYSSRAVKHINEGLEELRKIPQRKIVNQIVYSGKTFNKVEFEARFVSKTNTIHSYNGYMSTSMLESVAEGFIDLTRKWASGSDEKIAVIQRVVSKNGVYIDDVSDWGKNLGKTNHANESIKIQVQEEVLLNSEKLKQTSEPIPVMENGVHKSILGMKLYYIDFIEIL